MCYDVQNFDFSKGNSSFLELFQVIVTLVTIAILFYHQGILSYSGDHFCFDKILCKMGKSAVAL